MKKIILFLFVPLILFSQNITLNSVDYNPLSISENTLNYLRNNGYTNHLFPSYSQAIYVDFNNDSNKDIIVTFAC